MSYNLLKHRHNTVHLADIHTNYIITEKCGYCTNIKKQEYGKYANDRNMSLYHNFQNYWNTVMLDQDQLGGQYFNNVSVNENKFDATDICSICIDLLNNKSTFKLPVCKHIFHMSCISMWTTHKLSCPLCREPI